MRRDDEHRLSVTRRAELFVRLMDKIFPPRNGVPWHHCIDMTTVHVGNAKTCPVAQIVGVAGGDFYSACSYAGIEVNDRMLQHAGVLFYNAKSDDKPWTLDWRAVEIDKLNRAIRTKIEQRYLEQPKLEFA